MSLLNISVDDYGHIFRVTLKQDGVAFDASSFDDISFIFKPPSTGSVLTKDASFQGDGSDGVCEYTTPDGMLSIEGTWTIWVVISKVGASLTSASATFEVEHTY